MNKRQKKHFYERMTVSTLFTSAQKQVVFGFLREALNLPVEHKIKRPRTKSTLMTLQAWEALRGPLNYADMAAWIGQKKLCTRSIAQLIEEFRTEMISKDNVYANFVSAFQNWFNKGYLSKKPEQALWKNSPYNKNPAGVVHTTQGASI